TMDHEESRAEFSVGFQVAEGELGAVSADELVALVLGVQLAYDVICDGMGYPRSDREVTRLRHPNSLVNFKGLRGAVGALAALVQRVPQIIADLVTIRSRVPLQKAKLGAEFRVAQVREATAAAKLADMKRVATTADAK